MAEFAPLTQEQQMWIEELRRTWNVTYLPYGLLYLNGKRHVSVMRHADFNFIVDLWENRYVIGPNERLVIIDARNVQIVWEKLS